MRFVFILLAAMAQTSGWKTATELPNVDLSGLSADNKAAVLKLLRMEKCTCECGMTMAQCRIEDPNCSYSKASAIAAVKAIRAGKRVDEARALARKENQPKILDDPIKLPIDGDPSKGPAGARITLVEFSDFQCPYCSTAIGQLDEILKQFPTEVRLVFKQFPIDGIHANAKLAAQASLAAHKQGKFWEMHDRLYANGSKLSRDNMLKWGKEIGLDMPRFTADMDAPETNKTVLREVAEGDQAGVEGTPTVFVNGQHYNGSLEPKVFAEILRSELKK